MFSKPYNERRYLGVTNLGKDKKHAVMGIYDVYNDAGAKIRPDAVFILWDETTFKENLFFVEIDMATGTIYGKKNLFDLLWMRNHICSDEFAWDKTVVCGHTPLRDVLIKEKLIGIDTGLYCFGTLSAIDVLTNQLYQVWRF